MSLLDFLKAPRNSVAREKLLHMKAALEMRLHAAKFEAQIQMTEPEIDNNGYDFTVSHGHYHLYLQNKSVIKKSRWKKQVVHPIFLQPSFCDFNVAPGVDGVSAWSGEGASGGVLLHVIDEEAAERDSLRVTYHYFDIFFAGAVAVGLFSHGHFSQTEAQNLLREIRDGCASDRLKIPFRAFLPVSSPAAVIALRFHLPNPSNYISLIRPAYELVMGGEGINADLNEIWEESVSPWVLN